MLRLAAYAYAASQQATRDRGLYVCQGMLNANLEFLSIIGLRESNVHIEASYTLTLTRSRRNSRAYINYNIRCCSSSIVYIDEMSQYLVRNIFIMRNKIVLTFLTFRRRLHVRGSGSYRERSISPCHCRDAQSTEKSVFYGLLSLVSVYGQTNDLWQNLWIFSYSVRLLSSPPIALSRSRYSTGKKDESTDSFVLCSATPPPPPRL